MELQSIWWFPWFIHFVSALPSKLHTAQMCIFSIQTWSISTLLYFLLHRSKCNFREINQWFHRKKKHVLEKCNYSNFKVSWLKGKIFTQCTFVHCTLQRWSISVQVGSCRLLNHLTHLKLPRLWKLKKWQLFSIKIPYSRE